MVTAGEKYTDQLGWGEVEQFHTVEQNGNKFRLFDVVRIKTKNHALYMGEIAFITDGFVVILPNHMPAQTIKFEEIESISQ